jgi:hypothetical protein
MKRELDEDHDALDWGQEADRRDRARSCALHALARRRMGLRIHEPLNVEEDTLEERYGAELTDVLHAWETALGRNARRGVDPDVGGER